MTERGKIISIYVVVAILSVGVFVASFWLRESRKRKFSPVAEDLGGEEAQVFGTLEKDLVLTNQDGEEVALSELKDKVWVASNFFASCKYCLATASEDLNQLYKEFGSDPDFRMVSITINPKDDSVAQLKSYADHMEAKSGNWWFLRGDEKTVHEYLEKEMGFLQVVRNEDSVDLFSHDRSLLVYNGWTCVKKRDLQFARTKGDQVREIFYQDVRTSIMKSLASDKRAPVKP